MKGEKKIMRKGVEKMKVDKFCYLENAREEGKTEGYVKKKNNFHKTKFPKTAVAEK